jgi:hypothetical protein
VINASSDCQLVCKRIIPALDSESLEFRDVQEVLLRRGDRFVLYLSDGAPLPHREERLVSLSVRQALLWLNEGHDEAGSFWE